MFKCRLDELIIEDACRKQLSKTEKTILRCEKINWFLYKSDYILGKRVWDIRGISKKREILDGLVEYILCEDEIRPICSFSTTVYARRMRSMV